MFSNRSLVRSLTPLAAGGAAATVAYLAAGRHLRWGALREEVDQAMPGDDLISEVTHEATRAITVDAPVDYVWPWVAQLGQHKGGFYSYNAFENMLGCRMPNADRIVAEWQYARPGDEFRLHPELVLVVDSVEIEHSLVVRSPRPEEGAPAAPFDFSWSFLVTPNRQVRGTRLLVRERYHAHNDRVGAMITAGQPLNCIMTVGMLRGIRGRAEQLYGGGV